MKATSFKKFTTTLMLITTMSFSSVIYAEEVALPVITKPAILQEGTQRELTAAQIAELLPWAKNSKSFLIDLLDSIQNMTATDQAERMVEGIKSVVSESAPKNSELLMRYALNRSLVLSETLSKEMGSDEVGTIDAKVRILKLSINMALKYYDADMDTMSKKAPTNFAEFGIQYFSFLNEVNKSVFDASAQYTIQRISLEWLQWDLYRDLNNTSYAPQIVKINNNLKVFPSKKITDAQAINYIRQMKQVASTLQLRVVRNTPSNTNSNEQSSSSVGYNSGGNAKIDRDSLLECVALKGKDVAADRSMIECRAEIKSSGFDFTNSNFKKCFDTKYATLSSGPSVDQCVDLVKGGFDFDSTNYKACYALAFNELSADASVNFCVPMVKKVDFNNDSFKKCYQLEFLTRSSTGSIKACEESVYKKKIDFTSKEFSSCYNYIFKDLSSAASITQCVGYVEKTNMNFSSTEFDDCFTTMYKTLSAADSVRQCVQIIGE